nr:integrase, catalytic region, zinc finger, CCHC-type, peptidase aspartic, catalytic [Tanacetum cinerariifolium]
MSTQQDIYVVGSESRPPMLNKENYVPWSSRLLRYAKSRLNRKLIHNSIINGPYVRRMIPEPGDTNREVPMNETFHVQTDDELTEKKLKQIEADDQAIQTILLGLPEDIYDAVDSCETAHEIWLRVQQMMKGSDIGIQEKQAKLFNEWERFTSSEKESIESYYHCFLKLMNDLKRNKHFPKKIASNLKFLNNLQPKWSRHITNIHQTKDLHITDYTQLYDFLKYNQKEVDELKDKRLAKIQDPLALMANSNNPYDFSAPHQDQPSYNQNYMQQSMPNPEDITDPTTAMNMALALMAKAFKLNYSTPTNNNKRISSNPRNRQIAQPGMNMVKTDKCGWLEVMVKICLDNMLGNGNQTRNGNLVTSRAEGNVAGQNGNQIRCYNCRGVGYFAWNYTVRLRRKDAAYLQTQLLIAQKEEARIQLQDEEFDLMAAATDKAPVYDSDESAEVYEYENCYDNEIFNMFTQEEQYTELLKPIPEQHQVPQNDNNVIFKVTSMEQNDTTPSVVRKFLNKVKSTIVTLQRVVKHRMTLGTHNWSFSAHQELHKIVKDEIFPIVNQVNARVQNFEIQFLKEAAKFVGDFKSLAKEADDSLAKHKALELEIERLLRAVVSQDIMSIVQKASIVDTLNLQTELERTKERFENYIIKKENEYAKLWNDWYKKCDECKFDKISYDKAYKDMQQKIERLQAQLEDLKGCSKHMTINLKLLNNFVWKFWGTVRFENDHVAAIIGFGDLQWENIMITRVYFVKGLGHNLFSVGQFCDLNLEVPFRRNACFVRYLEGVDLLKKDRSTNLYTITLHEMASASPICLMARASSTKSWLWH